MKDFKKKFSFFSQSFYKKNQNLPFIFLLVFLVCPLFLFKNQTKAASCSLPSPGMSAEEIQSIVDECTRLVNEYHQQGETLSKQIAIMDSQIKLAMLKISQTKIQIESLEKEIDILSGKISRLDDSLNYLSRVLLQRVAENYKAKKKSPLLFLLSSNNFGDFIFRYRYLQTVQLHDRELLLSMERTKLNYDEQKQLKEEAQAKLKNLNQQLETQKQQLALQVRDKEKLLEETKGKEAEYQKILSAALAEQEAIIKAIQQAVLKLADGTKVEKGKEIALIGNTGYPCCSTGTHLHFMVTVGCQKDEKGVLKGCAAVNPASYLKNIPVTYDKDVVPMNFSGDWDWPIENPRITQEYGMSYWARTGYYGGKPHNGIDMVSSNPIIRAPKEGVLYRQSTTCGGCNGKCCARVNFVVLDHGDGVYSWYWHIQ